MTYYDNGQVLKDNNLEIGKSKNNENDSDSIDCHNNLEFQSTLGTQTNNPENTAPCHKSVASVASAASAAIRDSRVIANQTKIKNKGADLDSPEVPCLYCDYKDQIDFDLSLHYLEKHKTDLFQLPIGKGSMEARADYAVELAKKKLAKALGEEFEEHVEVGDQE